MSCGSLRGIWRRVTDDVDSLMCDTRPIERHSARIASLSWWYLSLNHGTSLHYRQTSHASSSSIQARAISFANPSRKTESRSSPVAPFFIPVRQSQPLFPWLLALLPFPFPFILTRTADPLVLLLSVSSSTSISLPTSEKPLLPVKSLMLFFSSSLGGAGRLMPLAASRVDFRHSSHWE